MYKPAILFICTFLATYGSGHEVDKDWMENILKHSDNAHDLEKIISLEVEPVLKNLTLLGSEDKKIILEVVLHDGTKTKRTVILKLLPTSPAYRKQIEDSGIFAREIMIYEDPLTKMERLLYNKNDKSEPLWQRAYGLREYDQLVLEDLIGEKGYKLADRWHGLDLDQSVIAVKALAKFHAVSAVANDEHKFREELKHSLIEKNYVKLKDFYEVLFNNFAHVIEEKWGEEWHEAAKKIKEVAPHVKDKLKKLALERDTFIDSLNIGAPNVRNIYFKYDITDLYHSEKPLAARLSYFQVGYVNSPIHDLQYFLNTSPNIEVYPKQRLYLLGIYFDELLHYLRKFKFHGKEPSHDDYVNEMKRLDFEGLTIAIQILPLRFEEEKSHDYSEHNAELNAHSNTTVLDTSGMHTKEFETYMKIILKKALEDHVI